MKSLNVIAANLTEIDEGEVQKYFSYSTLVAVRKGNTLYITTRHYSNTTSRHIGKIKNLGGIVEMVDDIDKIA
jgi:hypothetical protein